jgi:hypothetical protein
VGVLIYKLMKYLRTYEEMNFDFNYGNCNVYAIALHRLYDYPLYVVNLYFKEDEWEEQVELGDPYFYDHETAHVCVKLPNGKYLDSDGEFEEDKLIELCMTDYTEYVKIEAITEFVASTCYLGYCETETV